MLFHNRKLQGIQKEATVLLYSWHPSHQYCSRHRTPLAFNNNVQQLFWLACKFILYQDNIVHTFSLCFAIPALFHITSIFKVLTLGALYITVFSQFWKFYATLFMIIFISRTRKFINDNTIICNAFVDWFIHDILLSFEKTKHWTIMLILFWDSFLMALHDNTAVL